MGRKGQTQTPGQGQDNGHYPTESNVTAILRVIGVSSRVAAISESSGVSSKSNVAAILKVVGENAS